MGMSIPEIKEFHRKTNFNEGHDKLDYGSTAAASFVDYSGVKNLIADVDVEHLVLATPQCAQVAQNSYQTTNSVSYQGIQCDQGGPNRETIKEMRRTHFEVGYDDTDWNDTSHLGAFVRHPFTATEGHSDRVRLLRATNLTLGFDDVGSGKNWKSTNHSVFNEGPGSAAYPEGIKRRF